MGSQAPSPVTSETPAGGAGQMLPPEHNRASATEMRGIPETGRGIAAGGPTDNERDIGSGPMDNAGFTASGQASAPLSGGRNPQDTSGIGSEGERGRQGIVGSASVPNAQGHAGTSAPEEGAATTSPIENWADNPAEEQRERHPGDDVSDTTGLPLNP